MTAEPKSCHLPSRKPHSSGHREECDWQRLLPAEWCDAVDAPLYFRHFSEYEVQARRSLGYDEDDRPCFISYQFVLTRLITDDDEEFYEAVSYREEGAAWRLRDERWLVFRRVDTGQEHPVQGFYAISPDMPR